MTSRKGTVHMSERLTHKDRSSIRQACHERQSLEPHLVQKLWDELKAVESERDELREQLAQLEDRNGSCGKCGRVRGGP